MGAWRQHGYGNLRLRDGLIVGVLLARSGWWRGRCWPTRCGERALELSFAAVQLFFAYRLARRAIKPPEPPEANG